MTTPTAVTYELTLAANAKPFAWGPLAAALYVNDSVSDDCPRIVITTKPIALLDPKAPTSNASLVRKPDGMTWTGNALICKTLAETHPKAQCDESSLIELMDDLLSSDNTAVANGLKTINARLTFSTYSAVTCSISDLSLWGAIKGNPQTFNQVLSGKYPQITRWYKELMDTSSMTTQAAQFVKDATVKPKAATKQVQYKLEGAVVGNVVTRFPPEPSGYLHIGHAKAAILNATAATDYQGTLILRFDDTNPSKETTEFQESQQQDLKTLGVFPNKITFTSNYFDQIEQYCIQIIESGNAYCDDTPVDQMRKERMDGIESASRRRPIQDNLRIFNEMKIYSEEGRKFCVRAKISIDNKNKALRDPVIYRCNNTVHHRTGDKFKMYPTYDFACPIVDSMEGVTHALRTLEYKDRDAQYAWMLKTLGLRPVKIIGFSRMNFVKTVLSKRKLQWFVDKGFVSGWDDPRFPTVRGVMRRGCVIEALRKFIISQGPSKNINNLEWASFWAENKKVIDPVAKRFTCITTDKRVLVTLTPSKDVPNPPEIRKLPCHKKNNAVGDKDVYYGNQIWIEQEDARTFKQDEEITLMDWGNAIIRSIDCEVDGTVTAINADLHLDGDFKKTEKKITWVANVKESLTPCILTTFDHLITKDKLEEGDDIADYVNHDSVAHVEATGDLSMKTLPVGSIIQFERKGYFRLDRAYDPVTNTAGEFFLIPDGKTVNRYGAKA